MNAAKGRCSVSVEPTMLTGTSLPTTQITAWKLENAQECTCAKKIFHYHRCHAGGCLLCGDYGMLEMGPHGGSLLLLSGHRVYPERRAGGALIAGSVKIGSATAYSFRPK